MVRLYYCAGVIYCCAAVLLYMVGSWVIGGWMGGVGLVHGLRVGGCVGIIPAPLAYQPVYRC